MTRRLAQAPGVCVLGMHRSGTSLVTGTLAEMGLHLGAAAHQMAAREDNPDGFFEHQPLTDLNDEILWRFGGSWHEPPTLPPDWTQAPTLDGVRTRALRLLEQDFGDGRPWVWKDPRTCLTLPFWRELLPSLRFVISVRSPIDVARSLKVRDGFPIEKAVTLWLRYMHGALAHSSGAARLLVSYDDVVDEPAVERARLANFIRDGVAHDDLAEAPIALVDGRLRHHRSTLLDVATDARLPYAVQALYVSLRLLTDGQRGSAAGDDRLEAIASLSGRPDDANGGAAEGVLRDQIVDLRWVMHQAVSESRRLQQVLDAQTGELNAARQVASTLAEECERALQLRRSELSALEVAAGVEAALRAEVGALADHAHALAASRAALAAHVETPRGAAALLLRLLLPTSVYGGLRDALGSRRR